MQRFTFPIILLLGAVLSGCSSDERSADGLKNEDAVTQPSSRAIFVVEQGPPSLVYIDIGRPGGSRGDVLAFDAEITSDDDMLGKLSGMITTVDITESGQATQDRITEIVFRFSGVGTLVVGGKSVYPFDESGTEEMALNNVQLRPVLGGTGDFLGAQGQVATTRHENSTYSHTFELVNVAPWQDGPSDEQQTFTLNQGIPAIVHVDLGRKGKSPGDLLAVESAFTSAEGLSGKVSGMITTVAVPEPDETFFQDRFAKLVFDFGEGNTLVMFGNSDYPADSSGTDELAIGLPVVKPIVGGTGAYSGARGQVHTLRNEDNTYTQTFQLVGMGESNASTDAPQNTLNIDQAPPYLAHVDIGAEGGSHGDVLAFDAELTLAEGLLDKLAGLTVTVDIPEPGGVDFQKRIGHMVFDFGGGNSVVIGGLLVYPFDGSAESEFEKNVPQIRAIIGGTGDYMAAQGQLETTRNDNGSYTHKLMFTDI